jgi:hypothetical protein
MLGVRERETFVTVCGCVFGFGGYVVLGSECILLGMFSCVFLELLSLELRCWG